MEKALKQNYIRGFPGLTLKTLRRHPPKSIATTKGHLDQTPARNCSNPLRNLVELDNIPDVELHDDMFPSHEERTHHCFATVMEPAGQIFTDLTGRMLIPSSAGNQYIFVLYD